MKFPPFPYHVIWKDAQNLRPLEYKCGYCGLVVSSEKGWLYYNTSTGQVISDVAVRICPHCNGPSVFSLGNFQVPGVAFGNSVGSTPQEIHALYEEARRCTSAGAYTAAVMACRKLLMHIAVKQGAKPGDSFLDYVTYLTDKGFVPPGGRDWVDHIRQKGNEANHDITLMNKTDAENLIHFSEMLLKFIYEFPSKVPKPEAPKGPS